MDVLSRLPFHFKPSPAARYPLRFSIVDTGPKNTDAFGESQRIASSVGADAVPVNGVRERWAMEGAYRMDAVVCGIDPGLAITGYGAVRGGASPPILIDAGVCRLNAQTSIETRLVALESDLDAVLSEYNPDVVAVEGLYAHYNHPRTAILMGHARGVILLIAARRGIEVRSYAATQVKRYLTGNGRATKSQVQRAIQTVFGLSEAPDPPDVADALAIALCCVSDLGKVAVDIARATEVRP